MELAFCSVPDLLLRLVNGFYPQFFESTPSMIPCKPIGRRLTLFILSFFVFAIINNVNAQNGQALFMAKCASCHKMGQDMTGPNLEGVEAKWGGKREDLRLWVHNWKDAVA